MEERGWSLGVETWPIGEIETYGNSAVANFPPERDRCETENTRRTERFSSGEYPQSRVG